jgi:hypothetical protein
MRLRDYIFMQLPRLAVASLHSLEGQFGVRAATHQEEMRGIYTKA